MDDMLPVPMIDVPILGGPAHGEVYPMWANRYWGSHPLAITTVVIEVPGPFGHQRAAYAVERIAGRPCHLAYVGSTEDTE